MCVLDKYIQATRNVPCAMGEDTLPHKCGSETQSVERRSGLCGLETVLTRFFHMISLAGFQWVQAQGAYYSRGDTALDLLRRYGDHQRILQT